MPILGIEGRGSNLGFDIGMGLLIGVGFILLNIVSQNFFIIGAVPDWALSLDETGRYAVTGFLAPVIEEIAFRGALLGILLTMLSLPFLVSAIITSLGFAFYHLYAYAGSLANIGTVTSALFGAFAFSLILCLLLKEKKWRNLTTAIIAHAVFNIFIISKLVIAVPMGG